MLTNFQKVLLSRQLTRRKISALNDKINHFLYNKEISYNWRVLKRSSVIVSTYIKKFRPPLTLYRLIFRISWKGESYTGRSTLVFKPTGRSPNQRKGTSGCTFSNFYFILFYFIYKIWHFHLRYSKVCRGYINQKAKPYWWNASEKWMHVRHKLNVSN